MRIYFLTIVMLLISPGKTWAQLDFDCEPINYSTATPSNPVSRLQERLDNGEAELTFDKDRGYLPSVLEQLGISLSSQMLVFSKTSFQLQKITPRRPRAVYFGDDAFVGWVQGGDIVEISTADPQLGAVFYTLAQEVSATPTFVRDRGQCIICHASSRTSGVPGHLVRSVFSAPSGQPHYGAGTFTTDYRSPLQERWGGWYVTGTHGKARHMGNVVAPNRDEPEAIDVEAGANVTDISKLLNTAPYLASHSDIVALMVLEHQTRMLNLITRANFETRSATHYDGIMNEALDRPLNYQSESTERRISAAVDELVQCLLFADEFPLEDPVQGSSTFAEEFAARGTPGSRGRSLRELDLSQRLMKYPCSYLIYSDSFEKLPPATKALVYQRLFDVLTGADTSGTYSHLTPHDQQAILDILRDTKSDLPHYWKTDSSVRAIQ
ncbi:hypothetical protein [Bythopirellula polymerisocia]|uniref:Cytochrome c domain-containing protein n=1 Tax=Bythopirellula polymerisocia TaxID=2528003 RepID=A0A5C6CCL7_9BACT|nr:hypothetical protein [Bythopirellula polymerisocia]TWU21775.1 hypothetical protein Pla144_44710 [Bythopirellula polymerisocia]